MSNTFSLQAPHIHALTRRLFMAAGAPARIADEVAAILVRSNLSGHDSHGVLRLPAYLKQIQEGTLNPAAEPTLVKEGTNTLLIDGNNGFGHYIAKRAMAMAIEKSKTDRICCVNFTQIHHIGRLGEYAEDAARAGCMGMTTVGYGTGKGKGIVAAHGGNRGALGTNPIAFGVPTGDDTPFVLDYATSVVAEGKLQVARSKGLNVPEGTIMNNAGEPTTDPNDFYAGGALMPFAKHKGYALSLVVCLLGGLSGQFDLAQAGMGGAYIQVWNIESFTPLAAYQQHVRIFLDGLKALPTADGYEEVLAPGDFEVRSRRHRLQHGIELPEPIYVAIQEWADRLHVSMNETIIEAEDAARYR